MKQVKDVYNHQAESYDEEYDVPYYRLYHEITWHNIKRFLPKRQNSLILDDSYIRFEVWSILPFTVDSLAILYRIEIMISTPFPLPTFFSTNNF